MEVENQGQQGEQGQQGGEQGQQAPAFDASKFVPVDKYSTLEREFGEHRNKYGELEGKFNEIYERFNPKPKNQGPEDPNTPENIKKFDFKKPEDVAKYQRQLHVYNRHLDKIEDEKTEAPKRQQREVDEGRDKIYSGYSTRKDTYLESNPEAAAKFANADVRIADETVQDYVVDSEFGPQIVEHLIDNPQDLQRLNALINRGEIRQAQRMITRWELNAEEASKPQKRNVDRVPDIGRQMGGAGKGKFDLAKEVRKLRSL